MSRLNDMFADWATGGGIFTALQSMDIPWKEDGISAQLDLEYHGNWSGDKAISPLLEKYVEDIPITALEIATMAGVVFKMFSENWLKQWATLKAEYDPIENYHMVEEMTDDETVTEYGKVNTREDDLSHTKSGTETETPTLVTTRENAVYGFNSTVDTPAGKETDTNVSGTDVMDYDLTETDSGSVTDTLSGEDTQTRNYHLERSGNIGVTTSQQMLESERNLWKWNFFIDVVFPDVDKVLTSPIY